MIGIVCIIDRYPRGVEILCVQLVLGMNEALRGVRCLLGMVLID